MKIKRTVTEEIDIAYLRIEVPYDSDDEIPEYIHEGRNTLVFLIDLDRRKVVDWPEGNSYDLFLKVRDSGTYTLLDPHMGELACIDQDYVPDCVPGEYGDYVELCIESDGTVKNLPRKPNFSDFFRERE